MLFLVIGIGIYLHSVVLFHIDTYSVKQKNMLSRLYAPFHLYVVWGIVMDRLQVVWTQPLVSTTITANTQPTSQTKTHT